MKKGFKLLTLLITAVVLLSTAHLSAKNNLGIGVYGGYTGSGLSIKYSNMAFGFAWNIGGYLHVHGDYWLINKTLSSPVNWYFGVGAYVDVYSNLGAGFRAPIGLQWFPLNNLEIFGEFIPGFSLIPSTGFYGDLALGLRFYIN